MPETSKYIDLQKVLRGILLDIWNIRTIKNGNLYLLSKSFCKECSPLCQYPKMMHGFLDVWL